MLTGPPTHRAPRRGPPAGSQSRSVRWALTAGELASSSGGTLLLSFCGGGSRAEAMRIPATLSAASPFCSGRVPLDARGRLMVHLLYFVQLCEI